jgi:hypothetical protein
MGHPEGREPHAGLADAREHARASGTCVDVAIALGLELDQAPTRLPSQAARRRGGVALERIACEGPVRLAADAKMRSWQRYLISGAAEQALDQLPDVALPGSVAEAMATPPRLCEFLATPASTVALARRCEIVAAGSDRSLADVVAAATAGW